MGDDFRQSMIRILTLLMLSGAVAFGQGIARVTYDTASGQLLPTNLLTDATLIQSAWSVKTLSAYSNATNYVVDVRWSENLLNVADAVNFLHTTNRASSTNILSSVLLKNTSGSSQTLAFNSNWKFLVSKPTSLDNNKVARLDLVSTGTAETDIIANYMVEGGTPGTGGSVWDDLSTNSLTAKLDSNVWQNAWGAIATNALTGKLASNANLGDWAQYSTNAIASTATNTIKWLTNLWGDVARGFGGLTDGQVLKYHSASATWTNGTDNTGGGGGGLTTNANQFGSSVELAIKSGVQITNPVVSGYISISNEPTGTVPTNTLYMGTDNYAGRIVPEWKDHNQLLTAFQPAFYNNRMTCFLPSSGTTIGIFGVNASTTGGTTVSHPAPNNFLPYMVQLATPATSNGTASAFSGVDLASAGPRNTAGANGYFYSAEFTSTNAQFSVNGGGAPRVFVGLTALASPNLTNLVVTTNATGQYIGLYASPRDSTEMWISARDASAEFRTNTGMSCITSNLYQFYLFNAPTSRFAGWRIKNLTAGTSATGWFSNNVPTNFMKFGIAIKNSTNLVNSVRFTKQYLEAPLAP